MNLAASNDTFWLNHYEHTLGYNIISFSLQVKHGH